MHQPVIFTHKKLTLLALIASFSITTQAFANNNLTGGIYAFTIIGNMSSNTSMSCSSNWETNGNPATLLTPNSFGATGFYVYRNMDTNKNVLGEELIVPGSNIGKSMQGSYTCNFVEASNQLNNQLTIIANIKDYNAANNTYTYQLSANLTNNTDSKFSVRVNCGNINAQNIIAGSPNKFYVMIDEASGKSSDSCSLNDVTPWHNPAN